MTNEKDSFGIPVHLQSGSLIYYQMLQGELQTGRVADLLCAVMQVPGLRAAAVSLLGYAFKSHLENGAHDSIQLECGKDSKGLVLGVSFTARSELKNSIAGIAERLKLGAPEGEAEKAIWHATREATKIQILYHPVMGRLELQAWLNLDKQEASVGPAEVSVKIFEGEVESTVPDGVQFLELADVKYEEILTPETAKGAMGESSPEMPMATIAEVLAAATQPALSDFAKSILTQEKIAQAITEGDFSSAAQMLQQALPPEEIAQTLVQNLPAEKKAEILSQADPVKTAEVLRKVISQEQIEEIIQSSLSEEDKGKTLAASATPEEILEIVKKTMTHEEQAKAIVAADPEKVAKEIRSISTEEEISDLINDSLTLEEKGKVLVEATPPEQLVETIKKTMTREVQAKAIAASDPEKVAEIIRSVQTEEEIEELVREHLGEKEKAAVLAQAMDKQEVKEMIQKSMSREDQAKAIAQSSPQQVAEIIRSTKTVQEIEELIQSALEEPEQAKAIASEMPMEELVEILSKTMKPSELARIVAKGAPKEVAQVLKKKLTQDQFEELIIDATSQEDQAEAAADSVSEEELREVIRERLTDTEKARVVAEASPKKVAQLIVSEMEEAQVDQLIKDFLSDEDKAQAVVKALPPDQMEAMVQKLLGAMEPEEQVKILADAQPEEVARIVKGQMSEEDLGKTIVQGLSEEEMAQVLVKGTPEEDLARTLIKGMPQEEIGNLVRGSIAPTEMAQMISQHMPEEEIARLIVDGLPREELARFLSQSSGASVREKVELLVTHVAEHVQTGPELPETEYSSSFLEPIQNLSDATVDEIISANSDDTDGLIKALSKSMPKAQAESMILGSAPKEEIEKVMRQAVSDPVQCARIVAKLGDAQKKPIPVPAQSQNPTIQPQIQSLEKKIGAQQNTIQFYQKRIKDLEQSLKNAELTQAKNQKDAKLSLINGNRTKEKTIKENESNHTVLRNQTVSDNHKNIGSPSTPTPAETKSGDTSIDEKESLSLGSELKSAEKSNEPIRQGIPKEGSDHKNPETKMRDLRTTDVHEKESNESKTVLHANAQPAEEQHHKTLSLKNADTQTDAKKDKALVHFQRRVNELEMQLRASERKEKELLQQIRKDKIKSVDPGKKSDEAALGHKSKESRFIPGNDPERIEKTQTNPSESSSDDQFKLTRDQSDSSTHLSGAVNPESDSSKKETHDSSPEVERPIKDQKTVMILQSKVRELESRLRDFENEKKKWIIEKKKEKIAARTQDEKPNKSDRDISKNISSSSVDENAAQDVENSLDFYKTKTLELQSKYQELQRKYDASVQLRKKERLEATKKVEALYDQDALEEVLPALKTVSEDSIQEVQMDPELESAIEQGNNGLNESFDSIKKSAELIKKDAKDDKVKLRVDSLVNELSTKRARLDQMNRELMSSFKKKDLQFKNTEMLLKEDVRKAREMVYQAQNSVERQKELLHRMQKELDHVRSTQAQSSNDQSQYRLKADAAQRQVEELQREVERLNRRIQQPQKAQSQTQADRGEWAKQVEIASKAVQMKKQEIEILKKQLAEKSTHETELKKSVIQLQNELRAAKMKKAG